jgi:hypothetical protein
MNHDELQDLLGVYALDALEAEERALLDEHLATCARCRAEVHEHRETAALLAHRGGDAPPGVWELLASSLEQAPPSLRLVQADRVAIGERRAGGSTMAAVAAAVVAVAAVLVVLLGVQVRNQDDRIDELQAQLADPMEPAYQRAMEAPSSQLVELASDDAAHVVRGCITQDGMVYLKMTGLPRLDAEHTYQLWGLTGDQLVSVSVLGSAPTIIVVPAHEYELFAITEEVAPGVVASEQQPVVAGGPA